MAEVSNLIDSSYSAILKDLQNGAVVNQLSEQSKMWDYIKTELKKTVPVGRRLRRAIRIQYGMPAAGNIPYDGDFLAAKAATYTDLIAQKKFLTSHIEVPNSVIQASSSEKGAFVKAMADEIEAKTSALSKQITRQAMGNGAGEIAQLSSASGTTTGTITVDASNSAVGSILWVEEGDYLTPYTSTADDSAVSLSNSATYLEVLAVDEENNQFTVQPRTALAATANFVAGDYSAGNVFVRSNISYNDTAAVTDFGSRSEEIVGLEILIDDSGEIHTIDRASVPAYRSFVKDGGGDLLVTDMVQAGITGANKKGDGKPRAAIMSHNTYNRFVQIGEEDRRLLTTADGSKGFENIAYKSNWGRVEFIVERYSRNDRIFLIDPKYLELYGRDFSFFQPDGNPAIRPMPSTSGGYKSSLGAELVGEVELFNMKPSAMARIENFILE